MHYILRDRNVSTKTTMLFTYTIKHFNYLRRTQRTSGIYVLYKVHNILLMLFTESILHIPAIFLGYSGLSITVSCWCMSWARMKVWKVNLLLIITFKLTHIECIWMYMCSRLFPFLLTGKTHLVLSRDTGATLWIRCFMSMSSFSFIVQISVNIALPMKHATSKILSNEAWLY